MQKHLDDWDHFKMTGNIKDYLRYRGVPDKSINSEHSRQSQPSFSDS